MERMAEMPRAVRLSVTIAMKSIALFIKTRLGQAQVAREVPPLARAETEGREVRPAVAQSTAIPVICRVAPLFLTSPGRHCLASAAAARPLAHPGPRAQVVL